MYIHETIFLAYGRRDFKQGQGLGMLVLGCEVVVCGEFVSICG